MYNIMMTGGVALFVFSSFILFISVTVNPMVGGVIENTTAALATGDLVFSDVKQVVFGVLANGTIVNLPFWLVRTLACASIVSMYVGFYLALCGYRRVGPKIIFTRVYWSYFDRGFLGGDFLKRRVSEGDRKKS